MSNIYLIGDIHTVSAFRLAGVTGVVSNEAGVLADFNEIIARGDAGIVAVTNGLASKLEGRITAMALTGELPVVIEIPGIDEDGEFRTSALEYVAEALGIAL